MSHKKPIRKAASDVLSLAALLRSEKPRRSSEKNSAMHFSAVKYGDSLHQEACFTANSMPLFQRT